MTWQEDLNKRRKLSYLMNDFDDVNLPCVIREDATDQEIIDTVVKFFKTESQLIYPAKSYFVALVYAYCIQQVTANVSYTKALDWDGLLIGDRFFKPYSEAKHIYDAIIEQIGCPLNYKAAEKTVDYFKAEFIYYEDDKHRISHVIHIAEGLPVLEVKDTELSKLLKTDESINMFKELLNGINNKTNV